MVFKIIIKPILWLDLEEAITWYEKERKGLGKIFFENFEEAIERIKINPNSYLNVIPDVKRILVKKFPYKIFYTISNDMVFIIGLSHAKRSNAHVRKRLKLLK